MSGFWKSKKQKGKSSPNVRDEEEEEDDFDESAMAETEKTLMRRLKEMEEALKKSEKARKEAEKEVVTQKRGREEAEEQLVVAEEQLVVAEEQLKESEKEVITQKRGREEAEEQLVAADAHPQWLYKERLARPGPDFDLHKPKVHKSSYSLSQTDCYAKPNTVIAWDDFKVPKETPDFFQDQKTTESLNLFGKNKTYRIFTNESDGCGQFHSLLFTSLMNEVRLWPKLNYTLELPSSQALIPDITVYEGEPGTSSFRAKFVLELKSGYKYPRKQKRSVPGVAADADLVNFWENHEKPDYSPIRQIYTYSCVEGTKYCALSTGLYTWFIRRSVYEDEMKGRLEISKPFVINQVKPSLAQAWAHFIGMVQADPDPKVPVPNQEDVNLLVEETKKKVKEARALLQKTKQASSSSSSSSGSSSAVPAPAPPLPKGKKQGLSMIQGLRCEFKPIESFDVEHGVVHRMNVHGHDAIVKLVDSAKDLVGTETLENEINVYKTAGSLCGDVLPSLLFGGDVNLGRKSLIVSYEGKALESPVPSFKAKAKNALQKLHGAGILHGDVALRNMVVDEKGKLTLIDLGHSRMIRDRSDTRFEEELKHLEQLFS